MKKQLKIVYLLNSGLILQSEKTKLMIDGLIEDHTIVDKMTPDRKEEQIEGRVIFSAVVYPFSRRSFQRIPDTGISPNTFVCKNGAPRRKGSRTLERYASDDDYGDQPFSKQADYNR